MVLYADPIELYCVRGPHCLAVPALASAGAHLVSLTAPVATLSRASAEIHFIVVNSTEHRTRGPYSSKGRGGRGGEGREGWGMSEGGVTVIRPPLGLVKVS